MKKFKTFKFFTTSILVSAVQKNRSQKREIKGLFQLIEKSSYRGIALYRSFPLGEITIAWIKFAWIKCRRFHETLIPGFLDAQLRPSFVEKLLIFFDNMKVCFISLTPILAFSLTNDLSAFNLPRLPSFNVGVMSQSNVQASQEGGFSNPANFKVPKQPEKPEEPTIPQNFQEIDLMDQLARRFNSIVSMAYLTVTTNRSFH